MPCFKHLPHIQQNTEKELNITQKAGEDKGSADKKFQKSTTDSEEKDKFGADMNAVPIIKPRKPIKQPKIKPNYGTKSGGMFLRKM